MTEIPDDIPSDVVALAKKYSMNDDVLVAVCRAILAERERCAAVAERLRNEWDADSELWIKHGMHDLARKSEEMSKGAALVADYINNS